MHHAINKNYNSNNHAEIVAIDYFQQIVQNSNEMGTGSSKHYFSGEELTTGPAEKFGNGAYGNNLVATGF